MNTTENTAGEYARTIAAELHQLEAALTGPGGLDALFGAGNYDAEDLISEMSVMFEYLNAFTLDCSVRVDQRGSDHGATIIITRTLGGPNCYIERDTLDGTAVVVTAYWGGSMDSVRLNLDAVSTWLDELVTM